MFLRTGDGVTHTRDHWAGRTHWAGGRRQLTFHLTFEDTGLAAATAPLRAALEPLGGLDVVRGRWLHLTLTALGFADEVDPDAVSAVADEVFDGLGPTGQLAFDTVLVGEEGVLLCPRPAAWLDAVVRTQRAAVDRHLGTREWAPFWPHTSLAYANARVPADSVVDALAAVLEGPMREVSEIVVEPGVALVSQTCTDHTYTWEELRRPPC